MATLSSQHHSFDVALASRYGIECAILIHHFQHWIRINQIAKRNIREGSCWTYQTRKEILQHFPYWTFDEVRRLCEKLVAFSVLKTANFNKSKVDKTLWYAFVDEKAFNVDFEFSNKVYERQICPSRGKIAFPEGKIATPIPDTKPYTKTTKREIKESNLKVAKEKSAPPPPPPPESFYRSSFEGKVIISEQARKRLVDKFGGMESLIDSYAEKLYRRIGTNPKKYGKLLRHDLVIEEWIEQDFKKPATQPQELPNAKTAPNSHGLNHAQAENWQKNYDLVQELIASDENVFGGLNFYFKAHVLKDKNSHNFSISGLIDHRSFCKVLDKHFNYNIEEEVFNGK